MRNVQETEQKRTRETKENREREGERNIYSNYQTNYKLMQLQSITKERNGTKQKSSTKQ